MNPRVSLVINCDTRRGWLDDATAIKDYGDQSLGGCRSVDFMLDGVRNKRAFLEGCDLETILFIDEREPLPPDVVLQLSELQQAGEITKLVIEKVNHGEPRWNDRLYVRALRHATGDFVAHFDGDAAAFKRAGFPFAEQAIARLHSGCKFVCQQTPLDESVHGMWWASTRFFFCQRATLDLDEAIRCLTDTYRHQKYGRKHCPCFEHIIALIAGGGVLYPPCDNANFVVVNWVHYYRGLLAKLNALSYDDVTRYIFDTCGGPLGASDLIAQPL